MNFIIYFFLSFIIIFSISKFSYYFNLLDYPNKRKTHNKPTAFTGGIALSLSYLLSIFLFKVTDSNLNSILSIAFLISIVGFIDDKFFLSVGEKLSLQIIPIFYLIIFKNLSLIEIGNYGYFIIEFGSLNVPISLLAVIFLMNSFNYFDGKDGILGSTTVSVLFILLFLISDSDQNIFLFSILIPLIIFLFFNFSVFKLPKLFLGDCGSLLIGFIVSFTLIYLNNQKEIHSILLAWSVAIFIYEFISLNIIRLIKKKNPFKAGQDHLHHELFNLTKSLFITNLLLASANILFFTIGYLSYIITGPLISLICFITTFFLFYFIRIKIKR